MADQTPQLYGTTPVSENLKTIWDRIYGTERASNGDVSYTRFGPEDFVRVMNIDDETFYWQALDPRDEEHRPEGNQFLVMKNTIRKDPRIWNIPAGATMVLEGWNAAIMIEKLYKKLIAKKEIKKPLAQGQRSRNFGYGNPDRQNEYIGKIFVGIERPVFGAESQTVARPMSQVDEIKADPTVSELAKELGIDVETQEETQR